MAALHSGKQDFSGYRYQSNGLAWQVLGAGGSRIVEYCKGQDSFDDVIALCAPVAEMQPNIDPTEEIALGQQADASVNTKDGHVASSRKPLGTHLIKLP